MLPADVRFHVIVVDDNPRFALHVWRYLGCPIGFGTGKVADIRETTEPQPPLLTTDQLTAVWWVPAADNVWRDALSNVLQNDKVKTGYCLVIVDVRGRSQHSTGDASQSSDRYRLKKACQYLEEFLRGDKRELLIVSSYGSRPEQSQQLQPVLPKSRETLLRIRAWLEELDKSSQDVMESAPYARSEKNRVEDGDAVHILVTGAGFEIRTEVNSIARNTTQFGLPNTDTLLKKMGYPFIDYWEMKECEDGFPIPAFLADFRPRHKALESFAINRRLDDYWDYILSEASRGTHASVMKGGEDREQLKIEIATLEYRMREAFRSIIKSYDWGYLNQSLDAAKLNWSTWLTTNYTGFADRSIELENPNANGQRGQGRWQTIASSSEAQYVLMRELHQGKRNQTVPVRYLFKLHGDAAQLRSMAIAGHDKEFSSPLSFAVDTLNYVYLAAERHLSQLLSSNKDARVVWHLVGHALKDRMLQKLIQRVCLLGPARRLTFIIVNPSIAGPKEELIGLLRKAKKTGASIRNLTMSAENYLARIISKDFPEEESRKQKRHTQKSPPPLKHLLANLVPSVGPPE